jgi:hypothetical protein
MSPLAQGIIALLEKLAEDELPVVGQWIEQRLAAVLVPASPDPNATQPAPTQPADPVAPTEPPTPEPAPASPTLPSKESPTQR